MRHRMKLEIINIGHSVDNVRHELVFMTSDWLKIYYSYSDIRNKNLLMTNLINGNAPENVKYI